MDRILNYVWVEIKQSQWARGPTTVLQTRMFTFHVFEHKDILVLGDGRLTSSEC